jgi:hypothetical protein
MCSEGSIPSDSSGGEIRTEREEDDKGLAEKAKDKLTGSDEEEAPKESGGQHRSKEAPPPGEEPTSTGHDAPKTGPA